MFLRLDVDFPCFNRILGYLRLITHSRIPHFLNHVKATRKFLDEKYPNTETLWMFRPETCPSSWDCNWGLHSCGPSKFVSEYEAVTKRLGNFKYFNTHGNAAFKGGQLTWTKDEIEKIEKTFNVVCLNKYPFTSIDFDFYSFTFWLRKYGLDGLHHINFHPCHLHTHKQNLVMALNMMEKMPE